jgi:hypothetical protein
MAYGMSGGIPKMKTTAEYPGTQVATTARLLFRTSHISGRSTCGFPHFPVPLLKHILVSLDNTLIPCRLYGFLLRSLSTCQAADSGFKTSINGEASELKAG